MSNEDTRVELATALTTVADVTGYPRRPNAVKPGDAWPLWRGSDRSDGRAFLQSWDLIVVLPAGEESADAFADTHGPALEDALGPAIYIERTAPGIVSTEAGDMYALMITGRTE